MSTQAFATLGRAIASRDLSRLGDTDEFCEFLGALEDAQFLEFFRDLIKLHVTAEFEAGLARLRTGSELSTDERLHFIEAVSRFAPDKGDFPRLERTKQALAKSERKGVANSGAVSEAADALSRDRTTVIAERDKQAKLAQGRQDAIKRQQTELQEKERRIVQLEARLAAMERRQTEELTGLWRTLNPCPPAPPVRGEGRESAPPPVGAVRSPPQPDAPAIATAFKGLWKGLNEALREPKAAALPLREPAAQPSAPPVPPAELLSFLELAIDARADEYLRQLALVAAHSNSIASTSRLLRRELDSLLDNRSHAPNPDHNPWWR